MMMDTDAAFATTSLPGADPELIYEALRFYLWAAGEGICPVDGEDALEPEEGLFRYSKRTGDEEWETIAERYRARDSDTHPKGGDASGSGSAE